MCGQQEELYAAESGLLDVGPTFSSIEEIQVWVDALRDLPIWKSFSMVRRVEVRGRVGGGSVGAWFPEDGVAVIELDTCHRTGMCVVHELAHPLAAARYGSQAHCPWFARTYLELCYAALGSDAYASLKAAFDRCGIDHDAVGARPAGIEL